MHARAPSTEATAWSEIVSLYDLLIQALPTPAVALNRAAAVYISEGPAAGLSALDKLNNTPQLARSHLYWASRADMLHRLGRPSEAAQAYEQAISHADNEPERRFLQQQLRSLSS